MLQHQSPKTLFDKIWNSHLVDKKDDVNQLLYIDLHLIHEVTSPQAFEGLRLFNRKVRQPKKTFAVPDHNVPTLNRDNIEDKLSRTQLETLEKNTKDFGIEFFPINDIRQGIVHIIGPEQGLTLPGMTIVCGDSHTSTHGALGALAFGIGTSEVEHVLATQCLIQKKSKNMLISVNGKLNIGVTAKDMILYIIGQIGTAGGTGFSIEFSGETIRNLSMESRMTICNMAIEAGARSGMIAVDQVTLDYIKGRPFSPSENEWEKAVSSWQNLKSDSDAKFDKVIQIDASSINSMVTWGTSPEMVTEVNGTIPFPDNRNSSTIDAALDYMGLTSGTAIKDIQLDKIFIGSCTNSRIEDLRLAANILKGQQIADSIKLALVVPGSGPVKKQAEAEGLDKIFIDSGFEWREPGCSMCLAMNADYLEPGERCASTSNRNFEGRQGQGGRTHLVSPIMAAAAAIEGHFTNVSKYLDN